MHAKRIDGIFGIVTTPLELETQGLLRIAPDGSVQAENPSQPPLLAYMLHEEIAHSNLVMLKGAGHVCMYDCFYDFNAATLIFLRG